MTRLLRPLLSALLLLFPLFARAASPADVQLQEAERLAWGKRFGEAERLYRAVLTRDPHSSAAAMGLAQLLLWEERYDDAAAIYRALLHDSPGDVAARRGLATAEYWSGDFRSARDDYAAVLRARPDDGEAREALAGIAAAAAPLLTGTVDIASDDQPLRRTAATVAYTFFSDPLTTWTATAGSDFLSARELGLGSARAPQLSLAGSSWFTAPRIRAAAALRFFRFPDGETRVLGSVAVAHEWRGATIGADVDRHELLHTASALHAHASETVITLAWKRVAARSSSAAALHAIRYYDGNAGRAADAYHLVRVIHDERVSLSIGASVAYRDTNESRVRLFGASAAPLANGFAYSYDARYDPYWTPRKLGEVRAIVAGSVDVGRARITLHLDGGAGHDRDLVFGPNGGSTMAIPLFARPIDVERTFHPWHASADVTLPLRDGLTLNAGVRRQGTIFYQATTVHFGFTSRL